MTRTKRHQPAGQDVFHVAVDERQFVLGSPGRQGEASGIDEGVDSVQKRFRAERQGLVERSIHILGLADVQRLSLDAELAAFQAEQLELRGIVDIVAIESHRNLVEIGNEGLEYTHAFADQLGAYIVVPVTFVPGRSRLLPTPMPTGSNTASITIGTELVALAAATVAATFAARMMSTFRLSNSATTPWYSASRTASRYSMRMFFPST